MRKLLDSRVGGLSAHAVIVCCKIIRCESGAASYHRVGGRPCLAQGHGLHMSRDIGYTCQAILPRCPQVDLAQFSIAEHHFKEAVVVSWSDGDVLSHQAFADE